MKEKVLMFVFIMGMILCIVLWLNCEMKIKDEPASGPWQMKVEYDYQDGYELDDFYKLKANLEAAFEDAGTEISVFSDEFFAPDTLWRDELPVFFQDHKNSSLEYYLVSVVALHENQGAEQKIWGATNPYPEPNVPPNQKWSFIFVGDIPEEYYGGRWTKHRTVTYTTIHELGHQRAGLTHPEDYPEYHQPSYPCIMHTYENVTSEVLSTMGFCWSSDSTSADNCRYFLRQQNQK